MLREGLPVQIQGAIFRQYPEKGSAGQLDIGGIDDGLRIGRALDGQDQDAVLLPQQGVQPLYLPGFAVVRQLEEV
jgi:hypothetical protein